MPANILTLMLGSAVISGLVAAVVNGLFNSFLKRWELREGRMKIAADLTRLNQERYIEAGRSSATATEVSLQDPARVMRFYLAELDAMRKERSTEKGESRDPVKYVGGSRR